MTQRKINLTEEDGTQVTDIEKKVDYPQFKKGFSISNQINKRQTKIEEADINNDQAYEVLEEFKKSNKSLDDLFKAMNDINNLEWNNKIDYACYEEVNHKLLDIYLEHRNTEKTHK